MWFSISNIKIKEVKSTPEIYSDIIEFINGHDNCIIFVSIDDNQYDNFERLVKMVNGNVEVKKESELKKGAFEYKISLVIDNLLNIERRKNK